MIGDIMKQKINIIILSIVAIAMLVTSFVFAINYKKESEKQFYASGYIINNSYKEDSDNVNKLYFEENTFYKDSKDGEYTFTNSEGDRVSVSEESFVHYSNGNIMSLKKGVAIDLNNIDSKIISYYNIFEGSVLMKKNEVYEINNLNEVISFSKMMYKISKNKYLIAAPSIVISFSDNQTVDMKNYVEIEYVSENVIRIYNDEINYQTISSNLYVIIDNIKIDLEYKSISKNNVQYLTMADMVINSDDNIEVLPLPDKIEILEDEQKSENNSNVSGNGNNPQSNTNGNNTSNNASDVTSIDSNIQGDLENLIDNLPSENEQLDDENEFVQPEFKVESMDVTTLGFENLNLSFIDASYALYGNRTVEILENSTGKVIQKFDDWGEGESTYTINSYFSLKPNTEYTLNVVGQYKIEETVYDRTFISKIFKTLDVGLEIVEDYVSYDSLSFAIYKNSYSDVNGFSYNITDKKGNEIVRDKTVKYGDNDVLILTEEKLFKPNTDYILNIKDIQYGNDIFLTVSYQELKLEYEVKTLKENPFNVKNGESGVVLKS